MRTRILTTVAHDPELLYDAEYVVMNDRMQRVHWLGTNKHLDKQSGEIRQHNGKPIDMVMQTLYEDNGDGATLFDEENGRGTRRAKGFVTVKNATAGDLESERARPDRGGYILGYFYPFSTKHITELLASNELHSSTEEIDGVPCRKLETETPEGKVTVWVDPESGYALRRCRLEKAAGKHLDINGEPYQAVNPFHESPQPLDSFVIELDDITLEEKNGHYVTTGATYRFIEKLANGVTDTMESKLTVSDIQINPDFDAMNAFNFTVPDGMQVLQISDDGKSAMPGFKWQDGKVVAAISKSEVNAIEKSVVALREDTLPAPAKSLEWDVLNESGVPGTFSRATIYGGLAAIGGFAVLGIAALWLLRGRKANQT